MTVDMDIDILPTKAKPRLSLGTEAPGLSEKVLGKRKATEKPDGEVAVASSSGRGNGAKSDSTKGQEVEVVDSESGSEIEFDVEEVKRRLEKPPAWIIPPKFPPPAVYDDYLAPFSSTISHNEANAAVIKRATKLKTTFLAGVCGSHPDRSKNDFALNSLSALTNQTLEVQSLGIEQPWFICSAKDEETRDKILATRAMFNPGAKVLVTFRKIEKRPLPARIATVKTTNKQYEEVEKLLKARYPGAEITAKRNEDARFIVKIDGLSKAESKSWVVGGESVTLASGRIVKLDKPPHCSVCHSEDHSRNQCEWRNCVGDINIYIGKPKASQGKTQGDPRSK
jgi:hypothetical protein